METTENLFVTRNGDSHLFFANESLLNKRAGTCDLVMIAGDKSFELTLKEKRSGNLIAYERIPVKDKNNDWRQLLEEASASSKIFRNYEFQKATAGISSQQFTLVPYALFKPGDESLYFNRNFATNDMINI